MPLIKLDSSSDDEGGGMNAAVSSFVIIGWTGRDPAAMEADIVELEKLGVKRPASTPIFYRGAASLLTQAPEIEVVGEHLRSHQLHGSSSQRPTAGVLLRPLPPPRP